jgi:hypothetical protein
MPTMTRSRSQLSLVATLLMSCNSAQCGSPNMVGSLSQKIVSSCLWRTVASLMQGSHMLLPWRSSTISGCTSPRGSTPNVVFS